jgi:hypothetical protein
MGLLSKAVLREIREPDEMGKALRDRILRLSRKKTSPYTALSLLKAYSSFQIGICFFLEARGYCGYASVGLGIEKISLPREAIPEEKTGFFQVDFPELPFKSISPGAVFWAFFLDRAKFPGYLLLLGGDAGSFDPKPLEPIIREVREILIPPEEKPASPGTVPAGPGEPGVKTVLVKYHKGNPQFQGIILEVPGESGEEEKKNFLKDIAGRVSSFGIVLPLPSHRYLILCPQSLDRELAAHRLSKDTHALRVLTFETDTPDGAFGLIQPYL